MTLLTRENCAVNEKRAQTGNQKQQDPLRNKPSNSPWFCAGSAEELQRRVHQEAADRQLRHADQPRQDGRALPLLQPAAPQPAGQTQETRGAEAGEEEQPGAAACGRIHRAQLLLRVRQQVREVQELSQLFWGGFGAWTDITEHFTG